jgi:hypothetical protein
MTAEKINPREVFFVSWEMLHPSFRRRVAGRRTIDLVCAGCEGPIAMADRIALIMVRDKEDGGWGL